jgi:hypothetical protein
MIPFKIYTRLDAQVRFKRHCAYQNQFDLVSRTNRFLPFIIKRDLTANQIKSWRVYDLDHRLKYTITPSDTSYEIFTLGSSQYLIYYGATISGLDMDCGEYYLKVSDNVSTWYSEVFTVKDFTVNDNPLAVLEWKHNHDVGDIIYQTGYLNRLYLDVELGEPVYETDEEVSKDIQGNEVDILIRTRKVYKTVIPALPEYIVDALSLSLQGADTITLTLPENKEVISDIKQARVSVAWINDGCFANVELSFKVEESLVSKTCNDNDLLTEVEVVESEDPDIQMVSLTNESGEDEEDGAFEVSVSNYDEPEYSLDNITFQSSGIFTGLASGTYTVYVRVESGKTGTLEIEVLENIDCGDFAGSGTADLLGLTTAQLLNCNTGDFI